jgi:hypothetical protein
MVPGSNSQPNVASGAPLRNSGTSSPQVTQGIPIRDLDCPRFGGRLTAP